MIPPPTRPDAPRHRSVDAAAATAGYLTLAIAMTWPLVRGLGRDVPGDLADPLLNVWTLAWDARHLTAALSGHLGGLREYWNANIFFPRPLALAYSEHLTVEAIEILPIWALTKNALLCYNLLFLSTFVLSALGAYLLVRETTGSRGAAFVAGLAYGFAPYRFGSIAHVQVLSSAWMPFTLYALHRYVEGGRRRALAGAVAAFTAQALSCGYYLLYFTPVLVLFALWDVHRARRWRDTKMWRQLALAAAATVILVLPFLVPYIEVRRLGALPRSIVETDRFAADVYAYLTADVNLRLWGRLARAWPRPEGSLFPGLTIVALAGFALRRTWVESRAPGQRPAAMKLLGWAIVIAVLLGIAILLRGAVRFNLGPIPFKATDIDRVLVTIATLAVVRLAASAPARRSAAAWTMTPAGIFTVVAIFAVAMSFGPHIHSRGRIVNETGVYLWFYRHVPGYDGLRVPARFAMLVALALAALAGDGIARLESGRRTLVVVAAAVLIVVESWAAPLPINYADPELTHAGLMPLSAPISPPPAIYEAVAAIPPEAVVIELPIGEPAFDARAMYFSTSHWRRLVNGYSGSVPVEYALMAEAVDDLLRSPERAWDALRRSGATHLVVHEAAYAGDRGVRVSRWAVANGAREVSRSGSDRLFAVRRP